MGCETFWPITKSDHVNHNHIIMPPTSKKLEGDIASGAFDRPFFTLFDA